MRIALASTYMPPHPGGIEHVARNLYDGYLEAGHDVRWVTSRIPRRLPRHEAGIVRVPCFNALEDWLGVPVPVWGPGALRDVRAVVEWADAVHLVEALYLPSAMVLAIARLLRKPVVLSQNIGFVPYRSRLLEWIEKLAYATLGKAVLLGASHIVLATPSADQFVRGLLGDRLAAASTFPVGIDTERFRPATTTDRRIARETLDLPASRPVVLFAARLVEKKGVALALETARRVPEATFVVAGDGPLRALFERAPDNVRWLGQVEAGRMPVLYHAADAVLLPSRGEGLPLFVQEAMACGLPAVISADEVYAADLLEGRVALGARREPSCMGQAVREALSSPELAARGRSYAEAHWGRRSMIERYAAILGALVDARQAHASRG
jgi:glycosyltransferase involved in cell wall biosynthesis